MLPASLFAKIRDIDCEILNLTRIIEIMHGDDKKYFEAKRENLALKKKKLVAMSCNYPGTLNWNFNFQEIEASVVQSDIAVDVLQMKRCKQYRRAEMKLQDRAKRGPYYRDSRYTQMNSLNFNGEYSNHVQQKNAYSCETMNGKRNQGTNTELVVIPNNYFASPAKMPVATQHVSHNIVEAAHQHANFAYSKYSPAGTSATSNTTRNKMSLMDQSSKEAIAKVRNWLTEQNPPTQANMSVEVNLPQTREKNTAIAEVLSSSQFMKAPEIVSSTKTEDMTFLNETNASITVQTEWFEKSFDNSCVVNHKTSKKTVVSLNKINKSKKEPLMINNEMPDSKVKKHSNNKENISKTHKIYKSASKEKMPTKTLNDTTNVNQVSPSHEQIVNLHKAYKKIYLSQKTSVDKNGNNTRIRQDSKGSVVISQKSVQREAEHVSRKEHKEDSKTKRGGTSKSEKNYSTKSKHTQDKESLKTATVSKKSHSKKGNKRNLEVQNDLAKELKGDDETLFYVSDLVKQATEKKAINASMSHKELVNGLFKDLMTSKRVQPETSSAGKLISCRECGLVSEGHMCAYTVRKILEGC